MTIHKRSRYRLHAITHNDVAQIEVTHMKDSFLWSKKFIPVYFIVAFGVFLLYRFYIHVDHFAAYYPVLFCAAVGIASIKYNYDKDHHRQQKK